MDLFLLFACVDCHLLGDRLRSNEAWCGRPLLARHEAQQLACRPTHPRSCELICYAYLVVDHEKMVKMMC